MKCKNLKFLCFILLFGFSCSYTKIIKSTDTNNKILKELKYLGQNRVGYIILSSGDIIETDHISIEENGINFKFRDRDSVDSICYEEVNTIYFYDHLVGAFYGGFLGALGGAGIGFIIVGPDGEMAGLPVLYLMAGGTLTGLITGGIIGTKIEYRLEVKKD